jgi:hypothetical protein
MGDYKEGQLLTVTIKNFKVTESLYGSSFRGVNKNIQYSSRLDKPSDELYVDSYYEDIIVESGTIAKAFKPIPGDVYRVGNDIYYARKFTGSGGTIVIENGRGENFSDDRYAFSDEIAKFQLMNPKLIVRDGKEVPQEDYELKARSHW